MQVLFLWSLFFFISYTYAACPEGSILWQSNCYFFKADATEFADAEIICNELGGHLASVHNAFENAFLTSESSKFFHESTAFGFWIGLTTLITPKTWIWTDNTTLGYTEWASNEPKNLSEAQSVAISVQDGTWTSQEHFDTKPFVCKAAARLSPPSDYDCGDGWIYFEPTQSCYGTNNSFSSTVLYWEAAEEYCEKLGGHLPSVHTKLELNFIQTFARVSWLCFVAGLRSDDNQLTWKWSDGTPFDYNAWGTGYPNDKGNCGCFCPKGIHNYDCSPMTVLCKRKVVSN